MMINKNLILLMNIINIWMEIYMTILAIINVI